MMMVMVEGWNDAWVMMRDGWLIDDDAIAMMMVVMMMTDDDGGNQYLYSMIVTLKEGWEWHGRRRAICKQEHGLERLVQMQQVRLCYIQHDWYDVKEVWEFMAEC